MPIRELLEFAAGAGGPDPDEWIAILVASLAESESQVEADGHGDLVGSGERGQRR